MDRSEVLRVVMVLTLIDEAGYCSAADADQGYYTVGVATSRREDAVFLHVERYTVMMTDLRDVDRGLVEGARLDPLVFARVYEAYFPRVYGYVASRMAQREGVEDVVSEVFFKVVQGLPSFEWRDESGFTAWIFRIAHNAMVSFWRGNSKQRTWVEVRGEDASQEIEGLQDKELLPDEAVLRKEESERMHRLVALLPQRRQEVIALRFFGELQNREIALILGVDEHTVASHICRGLRDLHRLWLEEEKLDAGR